MSGRHSLLAIVAASILTSSAVARAQEPGPPVEPEAAPYGDQPAPPPEAPPPGPPPEFAPPPAPVPAPVAPGGEASFGFAGQITIGDDLQVIAAQSSSSSFGVTTKVTNVALRPAVDFFLIPNLSIGGQLVIGRQRTEYAGTSTTSTELGVFARVGYAVAFSPTTSLWPRIGLGYDHFDSQLGNAGSGTTKYIRLEIFIPIVFVPAPHFFIGLGPIYTKDLSASGSSGDATKTSAIGLQSVLGGCFRGM